MEQRLMKLLGTAAKHTLEALRRALLAVFITGLLVALSSGIMSRDASDNRRWARCFAPLPTLPLPHHRADVARLRVG